MGMRAGLTEISAASYAQLLTGAELPLPEAPRQSIDKAWNDFHQVFHPKGPPLSCVITGDFLHPTSPHTLDDFYAGGHEWYLGFASPSLVQDISSVIANWEVSDFNRLKSESFGDQYNYAETFFPYLQAAYNEAASRNNALMIMIC